MLAVSQVTCWGGARIDKHSDRQTHLPSNECLAKIGRVNVFEIIFLSNENEFLSGDYWSCFAVFIIFQICNYSMLYYFS